MKLTEKERKKRYNKVWYAKKGFDQIWRAVPPYRNEEKDYFVIGEWYLTGPKEFGYSNIQVNKLGGYSGPMYLKDAVAYANSKP